MEALKAAFIVRAGLVKPGDRPDLAKGWNLSAKDFEGTREENQRRFDEARETAFEYARTIMDPSMVNYVTVEFVWI